MQRVISLSWPRRAGLAVLAVLLSASVSWASALEETLPSSDCAVSGLYLGAGTLEFTSGGEEWIEFSIELHPEGDVYVDGDWIGTFSTSSTIEVHVRIQGGNAFIEVRNLSAGTLHCEHEIAVGQPGKARADGSVVNLDVS